MAYQGTHHDINMLMLFPWPDGARFDVWGGQLGRHQGLTWRQYMALLGEYWEKHYRYPRHNMVVDRSQIRVAEVTYWGQIFGLCVRALLERGYLQFDGRITPPIPFAPPPDEYRDKSTSPNPIHHGG